MSNILGTLDRRFLSLYSKKEAAVLVRPLPAHIAETLARPALTLHESRLSDVFDLLKLQVQGIIGSLPNRVTTGPDGTQSLDLRQLVYLALAQNNPYVGRTINSRSLVTNKLRGLTQR